MTWEVVQSIVRHLLTVGAGWLISSGLIDPQTGIGVQELVGAGMAIVAVGWSVWNKKKLREAPAVH